MMSDQPEEPSQDDLYVATDGDDDWSGRVPEPTSDGDGPFATIERARQEIRRLTQAGGRVPDTVWIRGGRYERTEPVVLDATDAAPVDYRAFPGERPVLSGGRPIEGWVETTVNGRRAWRATVPEVADGDWSFRQLFVDSERRHRARLPNAAADLPGNDEEDFFWIADIPGVEPGAEPDYSDPDPNYTFVAGEGDLDGCDLKDAEIVALHWWFEERMPVADFDPKSRTVDLARRKTYSYPLVDGKRERYARYYVENVPEGLTSPGEWHLDDADGTLTYLPKEGEKLDDVDVIAPIADQLLRIEGEPGTNDTVDFVGFEGVTFRHTMWDYPEPSKSGSAQSGSRLDAAVSVRGARNVSVENCTIECVGEYAVELGAGCQGIRLVGNELAALGGGGVQVDGAGVDAEASRQTRAVRITDNHIHDAGQVFHQSAGILARRTAETTIAFNHINNLYYTGISCGWSWGYGPQLARDNRIERNWIHDVGRGLLSDMGGIYTLGEQPGTVLRANRIHDITPWNYGGWGVYLDEGSSHLVVDDNLIYDTASSSIRLHYGRENAVRNNVLVFGDAGGIGLGKGVGDGDRDGDGGGYTPLTVERNVIVVDGAPVFASRHVPVTDLDRVISDCNCLYDVEGPVFGADGDLSAEAWRDLDHDHHSVVADPDFADVHSRDFTLSENSQARDVGFEPVDWADVGPR
jgi:hypothetical protein